MRDRNKEGDRPPLNKAIRWARGLSDEDIVMVLSAELMKASATYPKDTTVPLQYELVHEIKFRFENFERVPKSDERYHDDDELGSED